MTDKPSPGAIMITLQYVRRLVQEQGLKADDSAIVPVATEIASELEKRSDGKQSEKVHLYHK